MSNIVKDDIDWSQYEEETEHLAKVKPAAAFLQAMIDNIGKPSAQVRCDYLPWAKTHKLFALRDGETTLWAGVGGHGKSELLGEVCTSLLIQEQKVAIASFEMRPHQTLDRQLRQFIGLGDAHLDDRLRRDYYEQFKAVCDARLWLYDHHGTCPTNRAIAFARYCFKELKVKHVVLDSLMKMIKDEDDYNAQKHVIDEITALARDYGGHAHVVAHLKKKEKETDHPDRNDVKGSGSIVDQVDNVCMVWRNKQKEADLDAGKPVDPSTADTVVFVKKQRNGTGWEGPIRLYHDKETKQYTAAPNHMLDMYGWPHRETPRSKA